MSEEQLRRDLDRLRQEIRRLAPHDAEGRRALEEIVNDLERRLDEREEDSLHQGLVDELKEAVNRFEAGHPRATAILNDIMVTLSNMGI